MSEDMKSSVHMEEEGLVHGYLESRALDNGPPRLIHNFDLWHVVKGSSARKKYKAIVTAPFLLEDIGKLSL